MSTTTTRSSLVARAAGQDAPARRALDEQWRIWHPVVLGWLRRRNGGEQTDDLAHAFLLHVLEHGLAGRANAERGRFRVFMFPSLLHWWQDQQRRHAAQKRGVAQTGPLEDADRLAGDEDPAAEFDRACAAHLLQRALQALERDCNA